MACECAHVHDDRSSIARAKTLTSTEPPGILTIMARSKLKKGRGLTQDMARRLRKFLRDAGLSHTELGRMTKMSHSTYSRFLAQDDTATHGSVGMVDALSAAMGLNLWEHLQMDHMPDTPNFVSAVKQLGGAVSLEAVARVRLIVRLPDDLPDAPLDWWAGRLMLEEQTIQYHKKLDTLPRSLESVKKVTRGGRK